MDIGENLLIVVFYNLMVRAISGFSADYNLETFSW